jgi:hypothetical protein
MFVALVAVVALVAEATEPEDVWYPLGFVALYGVNPNAVVTSELERVEILSEVIEPLNCELVIVPVI